MPNRLAGERSPYLLQHQDNPVDWYPWGEEALARARAEQRPLLVSIGYAACHWCHVMAHESFQDPEIAAVMNERFICVKVDREERPDVDAMCMEACQAMTGHGGWPLNAFLDPEGLLPFFAGTYFPPRPGRGMPSWRMVLLAVSDAWRERRAEISHRGAEILGSLRATARLKPSPDPIREESLEQAVAEIIRSHDSAHGGWGTAPKFPQASVIELLLARGQTEVALAALSAMAQGGIYDQVAGGFARYSVDATWTVPHFEKMLYDNALLARAYLHGWLQGGEERMRRVCTETLDWALREMRGPEGGFYCALDADSEGVEGKFYVWSDQELRQILGDRYEEAVAFFGPRPFEGGTRVLEGRGPVPERLAEIRGKLYEARERRVRPSADDKRITAWNALMVAALAEAGAALGRQDYIEAATRCANFLVSERRDHQGQLLRTERLPGFLDDHAYLLEALITLYEASFDPRWYREATAVADTMIERFGDPERGGFFTTAEGQSELPVRRKDLEDSPIPSGNSSAALGLLRLFALSGERRYEDRGVGVLRLLFGLAARHPLAFGHLLRAADFHLASVREVAIVGPEQEATELARVVRERFRPHVVLAGGVADGIPLMEGREPVDGHAAAYVCERFACQAPVTRPEELRAMLREPQAAA